MVIYQLRERLNSIMLTVLIVALLLFILFPLFWMVSTSFKEQQFLSDLPPQWIPNPVTLEHYDNAIYYEMDFFVLLKNSFIVAVGTSLLAITCGSLAAYSFSRYLIVGSEYLLVFMLAGQMFPAVMMVVPFFVILRDFHLLDTYLGLIIATTSQALPFATYLLKGFFDSLPTDLEEAAMIDGCNRLQAFYKIALPLALPGLISTALMSFIVAWDDYVLALTLITSDARRTLPVAMVGSFVGEFAVKWGEMMAVSLLMSLPVVVLFVFLQRYLVQGITAGAVKG